MKSSKKHLIEDSTRSARPTKRPALSVAHHGESAQSTQYASPAYGSSDSSTNPSEQSDDVESCTPCSTVQGFVDEVCFGMICCVKTQFLDDPSIAAIHPDPDGSGSGYHQLRIAMNRIHMLQTNNGKDIAILNTQASRALSELDHRSLVRYNVYVAAGEWTAKVRSFLTVGKSTCLDIDIHLYGSRSNSACVGRILSDTGLFLQEPDFLDSSILYHNPHEIRFPSIDGSVLPMRGPGLEFNSAKETSVDLVNVILGSLNHTDSLIGRDVDMNVITTELKPHQREALDFIARRETPHTSESLSLFKRFTGPRNRMYYEHSIIGCRRPEKPPEDFGGIIADEMGLGKTLTMISAIATTMEQAHQFQYSGTNGRNISSTMRRARATLVICPAVLLIDGWLEEVSRHVAPGYLRCTKYHGASKATETEMLESDIVLTTYATLIADSNRNSTLHGIYWFRIIIDEAHSIRQQQTKQFHAVTTLSAKYRWCLTGTPIQNTLNDLGALVRFLRVPQLDKSTEFYSHIAGPIEKRNAQGLQRLRDLLQCICLRRTKELLDVSEPVSHDELVRLSKEEREQYCRIGENHRQDIDQAIARGNLSDASSGLFRAILCLRIFCNSGLCVDSEQIDGRKDKSPSLIEQEDQAICSYCSCDVISVSDCASAGSGVVLSCSHLLCSECIDRSEKVYPNRLCCVICGTVCSPFRLEQEQSLRWDASSSWLRGYSSKLTALVRNVTQHRTDKCVVFSAWKKSIRLAASYLAAHNISVCVIDGSMTLPERRSTILNFQQDQTVSALLMTLGTGAVGLNLTIANRVHILEPQWNPSIEKQAIGRVIRLGQEKKVTIVRYIVEHTVEQHIRTRQEKKLHLAQLGWDSSKTESDEDKFQRVIDMKSLLSVQ